VQRLWLFAIGVSAIFIGVLWFLLSIERMGLGVVLGLLIVALLYRHAASARS